MAVVDYCCCKFSNRAGSLAIGILLLTFSIALLGVAVGFISGWEHFDTSFLVDASNRLRARCEEEDYVGNCTTREWIATRVDNLQGRLNNLSRILETIGPVWKNEYISLYCFIPWYGLANVLLIVAAIKEMKSLLLVWLVATVVLIIWEFVLLSILFSFDTTVAFVLIFSLLNILNFCVLSYFLLVVFSFYQELRSLMVKSVHLGELGRAEDYVNSRAEDYNVNKSDQE